MSSRKQESYSLSLPIQPRTYTAIHSSSFFHTQTLCFPIIYLHPLNQAHSQLVLHSPQTTMHIHDSKPKPNKAPHTPTVETHPPLPLTKKTSRGNVIRFPSPKQLRGRCATTLISVKESQLKEGVFGMIRYGVVKSMWDMRLYLRGSCSINDHGLERHWLRRIVFYATSSDTYYDSLSLNAYSISQINTNINSPVQSPPKYYFRFGKKSLEFYLFTNHVMD